MKTLRIAGLLCIATTLLAQVPAGNSYNPQKHPNPIVTWVEEKEFKATLFSTAVAAVGVDVMSLSKDEGQRETVELANPSPSRRKIKIVGYEVEVTFYPVMRQRYKLKSGHFLTLYTFRFPRAATTSDVLNEAAFGRPQRNEARRFGTLPTPDRIEVRGNPGLYFSGDKERSVYWFELRAGNTATTDAPRDELFAVLEDLL